jgi:hypothetical protein
MKHRTFYFLRVFALFFGLGSVDLYAVSIDFTCNVENGFNYQIDQPATVGYITSLTIGTTTLHPDLTVKDPSMPTGSAITAVAVLSQFSWNAGPSDPLRFTGQISATNKQTLAALLSKPLTNSQVQIGFKVFQFDLMKKMYFTALAPSAGAGLKGTVVSGTPPKLAVAALPDGTVKSPLNFQMLLQTAPQSIAQSIQYTVAAGQTVVKNWGVATP